MEPTETKASLGISKDEAHRENFTLVSSLVHNYSPRLLLSARQFREDNCSPGIPTRAISISEMLKPIRIGNSDVPPSDFKVRLAIPSQKKKGP